MAPTRAKSASNTPGTGHAAVSHDWLDTLETLVVAQFTDRADLLYANRGFACLLQGPEPRDPNDPAQPDLRAVFRQPGFDRLIGTAGAPGETTYHGPMSLCDGLGTCHPLVGRVRRDGDRLLLVAEHDLTEMRRLTRTVMGLNHHLALAHDKLARAHKDLRMRQAELKRQSVTDPLTGLSNRRHLMQSLARELARSRRHGSCVSVIMADIDHFKSVNDRFGHDQGDAVLRRTASQLVDMVRQCDLVARMGGEEFAIVAHQASLDAAAELAERMRLRIQSRASANDQIDITCSFGVAQYCADDNLAQLLKQADEALYASKRNGRNRVTRYDQPNRPAAP